MLKINVLASPDNHWDVIGHIKFVLLDSIGRLLPIKSAMFALECMGKCLKDRTIQGMVYIKSIT